MVQGNRRVRGCVRMGGRGVSGRESARDSGGKGIAHLSVFTSPTVACLKSPYLPPRGQPHPRHPSIKHEWPLIKDPTWGPSRGGGGGAGRHEGPASRLGEGEGENPRTPSACRRWTRPCQGPARRPSQTPRQPQTRTQTAEGWDTGEGTARATGVKGKQSSSLPGASLVSAPFLARR